MTATVTKVNQAVASRLISQAKHVSLTKDEKETFRYCFSGSTSMWVGLADEKLVCAWGLIPPTLLSDTAYLWLYTTGALVEHQFLFIRHSQLAVQQMLEEYPTIVGTTEAGHPKTVRWLRWLGAEISPQEGKMLSFTIRKK